MSAPSWKGIGFKRDNFKDSSKGRVISAGLVLLAVFGGLSSVLAVHLEKEDVVRGRAAERTATSSDWKRSWANCLNNKANVLHKKRQNDDAKLACERAIALSQSIIDEDKKFVSFTSTTSYNGTLAESMLRLGEIQLDTGKFAEAATTWRTAISLYDAMPSLLGQEYILKAGDVAQLDQTGMTREFWGFRG
jgi:hypothetical protein